MKGMLILRNLAAPWRRSSIRTPSPVTSTRRRLSIKFRRPAGAGRGVPWRVGGDGVCYSEVERAISIPFLGCTGCPTPDGISGDALYPAPDGGEMSAARDGSHARFELPLAVLLFAEYSIWRLDFRRWRKLNFQGSIRWCYTRKKKELFSFNNFSSRLKFEFWFLLNMKCHIL